MNDYGRIAYDDEGEPYMLAPDAEMSFWDYIKLRWYIFRRRL